jgi:hypothetical protein
LAILHRSVRIYGDPRRPALTKIKPPPAWLEAGGGDADA